MLVLNLVEPKYFKWRVKFQPGPTTEPPQSCSSFKRVKVGTRAERESHTATILTDVVIHSSFKTEMGQNIKSTEFQFWSLVELPRPV